MDTNRRHFSRIQFSSPGRLQHANGECSAMVVDISLKGALLRPLQDPGLQPGQHCLLEVPLGNSGERIRMSTLVAHEEEGCLGLRCQEIDLDSITHLRRLVELNLGDESLLHRELELLSRV